MLNPIHFLELAMQQHQAGQLAQAEQSYRQILTHEPTNADALHLLGVLEAQRGNLNEAVVSIRRAIQIRPCYPQAFSNLGRILLDQKQAIEATKAYRNSTELSPGDPSAWYGLGVALRTAGDDVGAAEAYAHAIQLQPHHADAHLELGNIRRRQGRLDEAIECHVQVVRLRPDQADGYNNLGNALVQKRRIDDGIQCYLRAVELRPESALFHANLGDALRMQDRSAAALGAFEQALTTEPGLVQALSGKGAALGDLARFEEALVAHRAAVELLPTSAHVHELMANTLLDKGETAAALQSYRTALELDPTSAILWNQLGMACRSMGDFEEALCCFRKALEAKPGDALALKNLATNGRGTAGSETKRLLQLLESSETLPMDRVSSGFALGKILDDADKFEDAFAHYSTANALFKQIRAGEGIRFSADALHHQVDRITETFNPALFKDRTDSGDPTNAPVFIVGMPRSGTTLVEQIAASHSQVFGAGELSEMNVHSISMGQDPAAWDAALIRQLAITHRDRLLSLGSGVTRVIDKTPGNILNLGLIGTFFPNARIILCQRDPRDNCLSCYFQWFAKNNLMFTYDLEDCATQYLEQERLAAHWRKVLPLRMLSVQYEELVADLEGQSRRLIDFLGLEWEDKCLDFYKTQRTVLTASVWQVRQPIYNSSVGRWKHYEKHLGPLLRKLNMQDNQDGGATHH